MLFVQNVTHYPDVTNMALLTLPADLFLLEIVPLLSILDIISLSETNKFFRSLFPNLLKTVFDTTVQNITEWAFTPLSEYKYPGHCVKKLDDIILPICTIQPTFRVSFDAFFKLIYNTHYFNLLQLNTAVYRLQQKEIQNSPFAYHFTRITVSLYIQKFKHYPQMIEQEEDPYAVIVYMQRIIPDEIKIRQIVHMHFDPTLIPDYTDVSTALAQALLQKVLQANHPNYPYKHTYTTQLEKLRLTIPYTITDPFLTLIKSIV
jgi:hypothetical protein